MTRKEKREAKARKKYLDAVEAKDPKTFDFYLKWLHINREFDVARKREKKRKRVFLKWFKEEYVPYGPCITEVLLKLVEYEYDFWSRKEGVASEDEYLDKIISEVSKAKELADAVRDRYEDILTRVPGVKEITKQYSDYYTAIADLFTYVGNHCENWSD